MATEKDWEHHCFLVTSEADERELNKRFGNGWLVHESYNAYLGKEYQTRLLLILKREIK